MRELLRTHDPVQLSWLRARLEAEDIPAVVLDAHTGTLYGGAVSALAWRVMVDDDDLGRARLVLREAPQDVS